MHTCHLLATGSLQNTKWLRNRQDGSVILELRNRQNGSAILRLRNSEAMEPSCVLDRKNSMYTIALISFNVIVLHYPTQTLFCSRVPLRSSVVPAVNQFIANILPIEHLVSFLSFLFSFKNFVPATAKNRVRVAVSSRVRVRVRVRVTVRVQASGFVFRTGNLNDIR